MQFLLDTNAMIKLMQRHVGVLAHVRAHSPRDIWLSAITTHELFYGAYKSPRAEQNLARLQALQFGVLEFDREDSIEAGEIRAVLSVAGKLIGPLDILIAGQARARDLTLVTHNAGEFARVPRLRLEDWQI